jgi:hypothetical protein
MGSLIPSTPIILFKQRNSDRCKTKSFYDVPSMTNILVLLTTYVLSASPGEVNNFPTFS